MGELFDKHIMRGISDAEIEARLQKVAPVMRGKDGKLYKVAINGVSRSVAFLWDANIGPLVRGDLLRRDHSATYHPFSAPTNWEPTLAEVAAQIDMDIVRLYGARYFLLEMPPPALWFARLLSDGTVALRLPDNNPERIHETLHVGCLSLLTEH